MLGLVFLAIGLFMLVGGIRLASLGGSLYFAPAGLGLIIAGGLTMLRRPLGAVLYLVVFAATIVWALVDAGVAFWPLFSRLFAPAVLAVPTLLLLPAFRYRAPRPFPRVALAAAVLVVLGLVATGYAAFQPRMIVAAQDAPAPRPGKAVDGAPAGEWPAWGRTNAGTRYSPLDQITPANVAKLAVAWTYRTGDIPKGGQAHVVTPLQVGGKLYGCTPTSRVFALDAESGRQIWAFDPKATGIRFPRCRGVAYFDATTGGSGEPGLAQTDECAQRILSTTVDARLLAVDARTGRACSNFGIEGQVDLTRDMGLIRSGMLFQTSAPLVARGLVIMGGRINDNQDVDVPSGVIRAFSARTGELVWAWDLGNPAITKRPPEGQTYTRSTPNVWAPPAYDDTLGLLYLPMGNSSPDFWAGRRSPVADAYSSAIVALDIGTGRERWKFNTVHHDVWDYDIPAQPALYDVPNGQGGSTPALLQVTKRGQIFLLDRRNGRPIAPVAERPVPQGAAPGDWLSRTQPYSVGMPSIGTERLSESRMWGATLLDQLLCRIAFRKVRYDGDFTPQTTQGTLQWPGWSGGMNWGSASIAENLGYVIVNDIRVPMINRLVPRADYAAREKAKVKGDIFSPQADTPFGLLQTRFMSPIGVPCQEPPYGTITAIDLATRKIAWSKPLGTVQDTGPLGIATGLQVPIGMPTLGGPITTASGLIFMAGTQDYYLRALDLRSGRELWKGRLPVGGETTPMTYVAPRSGRQFVLISAGGNRSTEIRGDYVIAYALPGR
ncbi:membrane-bound PQQ-dependent dehydrogenase, glucose/quinate/shikimate family [Sphingomonas ginsenosidivorax]|nr:membrane-bound PQQ-dependent dehydrogenase, glucose/quinate/shikimate family [Sphingomonas ginsenosidivorax]